MLLAQHGLLLLMGVGVNWIMHCDRRREWLLTQRRIRIKTRDAAKSSIEPDEMKPDGHLGAWGALDDGYGSDEERAEQDPLARHESAVMRAREAALAGAAAPDFPPGSSGPRWPAPKRRANISCATPTKATAGLLPTAW